MSLRTLGASCALVIAAALATVPAHAEPVDYVNPNTEGSVTHLDSLQMAAMSDGAAASASANPNGCVAAVEKPSAQVSPGSSTGMMVKSQAFLTCQLIAGATDSFKWQVLRDEGWVTMSSYPLTVSPSGGAATQSLVTPCRAGTWTYRILVTGLHWFHSASTRLTCVKTTDLFYIEP